MNFCAFCGTRLEIDSATFCHNCGKKLPVLSSQHQATTDSNPKSTMPSAPPPFSEEFDLPQPQPLDPSLSDPPSAGSDSPEKSQQRSIPDLLGSSEFPLCVSGTFPFVSFFDAADLSTELFRIETTKENTRCSPFVHPEADSLSLAVGQTSSPFHVEVYNVENQERTVTCFGHGHMVNSLASVVIPPSSCRVVSGGWGDETAKLFVFDALTGEVVHRLRNYCNAAACILVVPEWDPCEVYVGGWKFGAVLNRYDLIRGVKTRGYPSLFFDVLGGGHTDLVEGLAAFHSRNLLFSSSRDKTVRVWPRNGRFNTRALKLSYSGSALYFDQEQELLLVGLQNSCVEVWDPRHLRRRVKIVSVGADEERGAPINDIDRVDANRYVSASMDGFVSLWNPKVRSGDESGKWGVSRTKRFPGHAFTAHILQERHLASFVLPSEDPCDAQ